MRCCTKRHETLWEILPRQYPRYLKNEWGYASRRSNMPSGTFSTILRHGSFSIMFLETFLRQNHCHCWYHEQGMSIIFSCQWWRKENLTLQHTATTTMLTYVLCFWLPLFWWHVCWISHIAIKALLQNRLSCCPDKYCASLLSINTAMFSVWRYCI